MRLAPSVWRVCLIALLATAIAILVFPAFGHIAGLAAITVALGLAIFSGLQNQLQARRWATIGSFYSLTRTQFEQHIACTFGYLGYAVTTTKAVGDQGVDIIAQSPRETIAIQVKRYADKAPNSAVQSVHTGAIYYGCSRAILVCLGGFSRAAIEVARAANVELINGAEYADMVHRIAPSRQGALSVLPRGRSLLPILGLLLFGAGAIAFGGAFGPIIAQSSAVHTRNGSTLLLLALLAFVAISLSTSKKGVRRRRR